MAMYEFPYLNNAPIVEAVIVFHLLPDDVITEGLTEEIAGQFDNFTKKDKLTKSEFLNTVSPEGSIAEAHDEFAGFRLTNEEGSKIVQIFVDHFTFSHLKPYNGWDSLMNEALEYWHIYAERAGITRIGRIGIRYVNLIKLPIPISDFNDYLVTAPIVPEGLPQGVANFVTKVVIPNPIIEAVAIVKQFMHAPDLENNLLPITLDIDTFRTIPLDLNENILEDVLQDLRNYKNSLFFKHITQKLVELYQ